MTTIALTIIITALAIAVACLAILIAVQLKIMHGYQQKLDRQIKLLEEAQAKKMPHEALIGQENVMASIIGALLRAEELREDGKAFCQRADAISAYLEKSLQISQAWRGLNNTPPTKGHGKSSRI